MSAPAPAATQTTGQEDITAYLRQAVAHGNLHPDFARLLAEGRFWQPQALPNAYAYGKLKQCFANATRLALRNPALRYCEGYAMAASLPVPLHHAWVVDETDRVIDPTWRTRGRSPYRRDPRTLTYYGMVFATEDVIVAALRTEYYGMLFTW